MDDMKVLDPNPEVNAAVSDLFRAAGHFAFVTSMQYKTTRQKDYERVVDAFNKGLAEAVVVVALSPTKCAQLCMDVGSQRNVVISVPVINSGAGVTWN